MSPFIRLGIFFVLCIAPAFAQSDDVTAKLQRSKELMAAGRFEEAIPIYKDLVQALPNNPGPILNLGLALHMAGHEREAVSQFQAVLKIEPANLPARLFLGAAYLGLKMPAKAIEPLKTVVRDQPDNRQARLFLGEALLSLEHFQEAAEQFDRLSKLDPGNPRAWNGLGLSLEALAGRNTVIALSSRSIAAELVLGFVEIHEAADEKVEAPVVVVVKPDSAGGPSWRCHTRFVRHVRKSVVAVVVIEDAAPVLRYVEVWEPVAVVIAGSQAHAIATTWRSGFFRYICECAVAIVSVQGISKGWIGIKEVAFAAVHEVNIHPTVVVVVDEGAARPCGFRQVHLWGPPVSVNPANAACRGRSFFEGIGRR